MPSRSNRIENERRARRAAREALAEVELYESPAESDCDVDHTELDLEQGHRLDVILYRHRGRLVRFFMAWMCLDRDGEWSEKYSVCTLHGWLHEHTTGHHQKDDRRDIRPLLSQVDVQESHDLAYDFVHNRYRESTGGGNHG